MYQTLAERRGPITEIHLEDWFHPASQSVWITWLDDEVCDRLARRWLEISADIELRGASDSNDQIERYRLPMLPALPVTCDRAGKNLHHRRTRTNGPTSRWVRLIPSSNFRVWADVTRLVLELNRELAGLRRRVRSRLAAVGP